ncbi:MAG TPA: HEAT repeat domain-containing protein [Edaphobacter sp.]|jgi:hypothetical protein|nr:HEAT repeat domain-containing protein [Edaphobacter sp.]
MKCEMARDNVILAYYGELPDELAGSLEQHLMTCEDCREELNGLQGLETQMAVLPVMEPTPNFLAQSRMRLDEALDAIPPHGFLTRLRTNCFLWLGHIRSAPALATLLLGVGFIGGNFLNRYEVAHTEIPQQGPTTSNSTQSVIASVTGIERTPNSELVQVHYNRVIPETVEGSLDSKVIRDLLMKGASASAEGVRASSVQLLASECKAGHECPAREDGKGVRAALLVSLRYDKDAGVRLKALEGLESFIGQDQRVRDAVLESLAHDPDSQVRMAAVGLLTPVQHDSSVRQVLRTASTQDENPYIRTVSYNVLQDSDSIQ